MTESEWDNLPNGTTARFSSGGTTHEFLKKNDWWHEPRTDGTYSATTQDGAQSLKRYAAGDLVGNYDVEVFFPVPTDINEIEAFLTEGTA